MGAPTGSARSPVLYLFVSARRNYREYLSPPGCIPGLSASLWRSPSPRSCSSPHLRRSPRDRTAPRPSNRRWPRTRRRSVPYTWVETTEISLKGEVKKTEQKQCFYGADGKVQKTPIAGAAPAPAKQPESKGGGRRGGGRAKEAIIENKVDDMKDYMAKVAALVQDYVPPSPAKIQAAQAAGNVAVQPGPKTLLNIKDYNKPGDAVAIGFDSAAKKMASFSVNSYVEKPKEDDVTLTVTFSSLTDGTSYPAQTLLDVKAKQIQVKVTNGGYKKGQ